MNQVGEPHRVVSLRVKSSHFGFLFTKYLAGPGKGLEFVFNLGNKEILIENLVHVYKINLQQSNSSQ